VVLLYQLASKVIAAAILYLEALHRLEAVVEDMGSLQTAGLPLMHCPEVLAVVAAVVTAALRVREVQRHQPVKATLVLLGWQIQSVVLVEEAQAQLGLMEGPQVMVEQDFHRLFQVRL